MPEIQPPATVDILRPFRPRARLLQLLGDELIGSPRLAVFELVKNAHDADASEATVTLDLRSKKPTITVEDDGEGMTLDTLENIWLIPGDDHRQKQRRELRRTKRYHRLPLGEKGIGRFAVHKLGDSITLITRAANSSEYLIEIKWDEIIGVHYLDSAPVRIVARKPLHFQGDNTGTFIRIELRQKDWTRGDVRRLYRQITSICSPFEAPGSFVATLKVPGSQSWLDDLPDPAAIREKAIWKFSFRLDADGSFSWNYAFSQIPGIKLAGRTLMEKSESLLLPSRSESGEDTDKKKTRSKLVADKSTMEGIGPIRGEFYVYDRERELLRVLGHMQTVTDYLDENGGVRVYRDGVRVYNYGEASDDWLGIDLRRVNSPTRGISRNIILGAIHLSLSESPKLIEKTNREGFVESDASDRLRKLVLGALAKLEQERQIDKDRIRKVLTNKIESVGITKPIHELRDALKKQGVSEQLSRYVDRIEHDYQEMQETLLSAGMSGLNLAVIFHEVERGVSALHQALTKGIDLDQAANQAQELMRLLDGFSAILKKDRQTNHSARKLIEQARQFSTLRLQHHRIKLICPFLETKDQGFEAKFAFSLVLGALTNAIDNAIFWLRVRWPDASDQKETVRKLFIGVSHDFEQGPAIVIGDNGPGFRGDPPEFLVKPFFTRKPAGMGLGLYYSNLAMELNNGLLVFPQADEVEVPDGIDGALVALVFKGKKAS